MTPQLIGEAEVYLNFMHQNEVRELEEYAEDVLELHEGPFNSRMASLYDESCASPVLCSTRSFLYILGDMRDLLGQNQLDAVLVRKLPLNGETWRKAPACSGATLVMPIGPFDGGYIMVGDNAIPITSGDCVVVPHDTVYRIPKLRGGRMLVLTAHGKRKQKRIPIRRLT